MILSAIGGEEDSSARAGCPAANARVRSDLTTRQGERIAWSPLAQDQGWLMNEGRRDESWPGPPRWLERPRSGGAPEARAALPGRDARVPAQLRHVRQARAARGGRGVRDLPPGALLQDAS